MCKRVPKRGPRRIGRKGFSDTVFASAITRYGADNKTAVGVSMSNNIFDSEHNDSAIQTIRQTMSVSTDDNGVPVVSFATNRGKGSGAQTLPVSEFGDYVTALEEIAASGIPEASERTLTAAESLRQTIRQEDGIISFRVRSGKGAKPAKVSRDDLGDVAALLRSTVKAVTAAAKKLS